MEPDNHNSPSEDIIQHTVLQSVGLHLVPGILGGAAYFALAGPISKWGYPSVMAMILAGSFVITPLQLGWLYYQSRKKQQKLLGDVIRYLNPLPWKDYLIWIPVIILASGTLMVFLDPVTEAIKAYFYWLPETMFLDMGLENSFSIKKLILTYTLFIFTVVGIGPITEELYFRGYLLPRMPAKMKSWGPIIHSILFAFYHFWTPWFFVARSFAMLPLTYTVKKKKNIYLGIVSHVLLNSIDFFIGAAFIIKLI